MAAPNIVDPTAVFLRRVRYAVTTTLAAALTNSAASNKVLEVIGVYCANIDGTNSADITLTHFDGTTDIPIASTLAVPADATQTLASRNAPVVLEEGDSLRAQASANGDLVLVIAYRDIS